MSVAKLPTSVAKLGQRGEKSGVLKAVPGKVHSNLAPGRYADLDSYGAMSARIVIRAVGIGVMVLAVLTGASGFDTTARGSGDLGVELRA